MILNDTEQQEGKWELADSVTGTDLAANVSAIYQIDSLVRRATALQETLDGKAALESEKKGEKS